MSKGLEQTTRKSLLWAYAEPASSAYDVSKSGETNTTQIPQVSILPNKPSINQKQPQVPPENFVVGVSDPWEVAPGVVILAIQDPPNDGGQPGRTMFKPGLTLAARREILFDIEWFDVRVRRRQEAIEAEEL